MPGSPPLVVERQLPLSHFAIPAHYERFLESVIVPRGLISDRMERMARDIVQDITVDGAGSETTLVCLCVLKGAYKFMNLLVDKMSDNVRMRGVNLNIQVDFIRAKSYEDDRSTGTVTMTSIGSLDYLEGKSVLLIEDIVDTGLTMKRLLPQLQQYKPKQLRVASLIVKSCKSCFAPDYAGFDIPDFHVVGWAFDFNETFRDLNHVCQISDEGKRELKKQKKSPASF